MNFKIIGYSLLIVSILIMSCNTTMQTTQNADGSYNYEQVEGDPMGVKIYTLSNGLKVYMSVQKDAPRIQTLIATRAGSKNDPSDATGLAHYLEHMLFKGSSEIASLDWDKEKVLLKQISDLYEEHRSATEEERVIIYEKIDSLSGLAAQYVAANEYDKMVSSIGAEKTNAFTSFDRTVYMNDIPSNEVEKWLKLESERFSELVLRLFHTELEAVYEEYNIAQAKDSRKVFAAFLKGLLPNHPYGTQTTIGTGEHLKRPSMEKIHAFFETYYVPNNMAIILSGDFNPDEMVVLVEKYWGKFKTKKLPKEKSYTNSKPTESKEIEIIGKEKANVQIGWALEGGMSEESLKAKLIAGILFNRKAGLIDRNLLQPQKIGPNSSAGAWGATDYSFFFLYGEPRAKQGLESVKELLLKELERLKMGQFEDWLLEAFINNMELSETQSLESNAGRAFGMLDAFIYDIKWAESCDKYEKLRAITKDDLIEFAKNNLRTENAVIVYKREGEDKNISEVEKPKITPIAVNRTDVSDFRKAFDAIESPRQSPAFLNYEEQIKSTKLKENIVFDYIKNNNNELFELVYLIDAGSNHNRILPIATRYLKFLGTDKYSLQELQQEFFKLGLTFNITTRSEVTFITLSGLDRSFEKGIELLEHILANAQPDKVALDKLIQSIKKGRFDAKKDKKQILERAMLNYGYYGNNSPFKSRFRTSSLEVIETKDLMKPLNDLTGYSHKVLYYGSKPMEKVKEILDKHHKIESPLKPFPPKQGFIELPTDKNKVLFVNYVGMPQVEILMLSKGTPSFDLEESINTQLYNNYFGYGLSSIVFQEIRESKALAYSTYVYNTTPDRKDKAHYLKAFIGTQSDKLKDAIPALNKIIQEMPISEDQIMTAVEGQLKSLETERINGSDIYWDRRSNAERGIDKDVREDMYKFFSDLAKDEKRAVEMIKKFHANKIKGRKFTYLILGDRSQLDIDYLKTLGEYKELSLEELFGY